LERRSGGGGERRWIEELWQSSRAEKEKEQEVGCARGNRRRENFTRRVPKSKRGTRAGGKQLLAVDGTRGGSGGQRRDAFARGGGSGVGRAVGGRAGGQVAKEKWRGGSWRPGAMPVMGGGWSCRETERGKQEEEDEDLFVNFCTSSRSSV
jgi:hypothetical protein